MQLNTVFWSRQSNDWNRACFYPGMHRLSPSHLLSGFKDLWLAQSVCFVEETSYHLQLET